MKKLLVGFLVAFAAPSFALDVENAQGIISGNLAVGSGITGQNLTLTPPSSDAPATRTLKVTSTTATTIHLQVDASGNVGIGRIPSVNGNNALHVVGPSTFASSVTVKSSVFVGTGTVLAATYSPMVLSSNGGDALAYQLELNNGSGQGNGSTASGILFGVATDATGYRKGGIAFLRTGGNGIGNIVFMNDAGADSGVAALTDSVMVLESGGNIGIGAVTDPTALIHADKGTGVGQLTLDGSTGGCIMLRDTDDAGWTECDALDGTLSCTVDADGVCD